MDLGDGFKAMYVNLTLTGEPVRHRYESPGVYRVSVRAENTAGHDEAVLFVQVNCKSLAPLRPSVTRDREDLVLGEAQPGGRQAGLSAAPWWSVAVGLVVVVTVTVKQSLAWPVPRCPLTPDLSRAPQPPCRHSFLKWPLSLASTRR